MQEVRAAYVVFATRHRDEDNTDSLPAVDFDLAVRDFRQICGRDRRCGEELRRAEVVCSATCVRQMQPMRGPAHKRELVGLEFITAQRHDDKRGIRRLSRWRRHRLCYCDSGRERERDREDVCSENRIKLQKKLHPVLTLFTTLRSLGPELQNARRRSSLGVLSSEVLVPAPSKYISSNTTGGFMFPVPCKSTCLRCLGRSQCPRRCYGCRFTTDTREQAELYSVLVSSFSVSPSAALVAPCRVGRRSVLHQGDEKKFTLPLNFSGMREIEAAC
jgi:hypothetical protein